MDSVAKAGTRLRTFDQSRRQMQEAQRYLAGGVSSNFRLGISPTPLVFERADGPYLFDADGNRLASRSGSTVARLLRYWQWSPPQLKGRHARCVLPGVILRRGRLGARVSFFTRFQAR